MVLDPGKAKSTMIISRVFRLLNVTVNLLLFSIFGGRL